jgi:DinB superfamily
LDAVERDARALVSGLTELSGAWRPDAKSWSVAECLDHLAIANREYLRAMQPAAERTLMQGRRRRGPARPGVIGRWFVRTLEPPVTSRFKRAAPERIRPRRAPSLGDSLGQFRASHDEVRAFLRRYADIDLAGARFPNPFVRGVRFSLATGLHVIAAHERRHLWQARRVRQAAERAVAE